MKFLSYIVNLAIFILLYFVGLLCKILIKLEWGRNNQVPLYFKHITDYILWLRDPDKSDILNRGILPKHLMHNQSKILELCSGDGSTAYLFWSDIALHIDCVDFDRTAVKYAKTWFAKSNIRHIEDDVVNFLDKCVVTYDYIVWNSGVLYFDINIVCNILKKAKSVLNYNGTFFAYFPCDNDHVDHKFKISGIDEVKKLFGLFESVQCSIIVENEKNHYFVIARNKE